MLYHIFFLIAVIVFIFGMFKTYVATKNRNSSSILSPFNILCITVFSSAVLIFFPIYYEIFEDKYSTIFKAILLSIHNTIRLFIVDGEFTIVSEHLDKFNPIINTAYTVFASILFVLAPLLTFGAVISLFKNAFSYRKYLKNYNKDVYIFSELNQKSIALAKNIYQDNPKVSIIFNDVFESNDESSYEILDEAKTINAICFKNDITAINYDKHSKKCNLSFLLIGEDDDENLEQCIWLTNKFKNREKTDIYLFSTSKESELVFSALDPGKIKIRRINNIRSLVYNNLWNNGNKIFDSAIQKENVKEINAIILGMGEYGVEMAKALSWVSQMDGYKLNLNCFDKSSSYKDNFQSKYSGLFDVKYNNKNINEEEAYFSINLEDKIDIFSPDFDEKLNSLGKISYIFISLGSDKLNINASAKIRQIEKRKGNSPIIQAVLYNSYKREILSIKNELNIDFIGDIKNQYSTEYIFGTELEKNALSRHLKWGDEQSFWRNEYNYRSSISSAIHKPIKIHCKIDGAEKSKDERSFTEIQALRKLEHRRWEAYMLSEGYIYGDRKDNVAKTHPCIVPFSKLPKEEQEKDDN